MRTSCCLYQTQDINDYWCICDLVGRRQILSTSDVIKTRHMLKPAYRK